MCVRMKPASDFGFSVFDRISVFTELPLHIATSVGKRTNCATPWRPETHTSIHISATNSDMDMCVCSDMGV